jgi:uncharacterized protein
MRTFEIETPPGLARVHLHPAPRARLALVLGHGAGGGLSSPDLTAVTEVAQAERFSVALVEQPYRVAGRRSPAPAPQLDAAWRAAVDFLLGGELHGLRLVVGGRSLGARVACRTSAEAGAIGVLCLAFPLHPPGRPGATRLDELEQVRVPTLVVQGERDPFGIPPPGDDRLVVTVPGDHSLKKDIGAVRSAVRDWLRDLVHGSTGPRAPAPRRGRTR